MDKDVVDRRLNERGVSSVQFLLASVLALLLFVAFANLIAGQYGRGAMRSALEQGARAGAVVGSTSDCESTVDEVIGQLLGGSMSESLVVDCSTSGALMVASASAVFESWSPLTPDFSIDLSAEAFIEP